MYRLFTLRITWLSGSYCCPASQESIVVQPIASREKIKIHNSKFLLNEYRFCTIIKLKHRKSNHCKSGTICRHSSQCLLAPEGSELDTPALYSSFTASFSHHLLSAYKILLNNCLFQEALFDYLFNIHVPLF